MFKKLLAAIILLSINLNANAAKYPTLKVGDNAPVFAANSFDLEKHKGKIIVLYFYPKDDTPKCTFEAQNFAARIEEFEALGAEIVGVSNDDTKSHTKFQQKYQLPFTLISDTKDISEKYGIKGFLWNKRATFLIDREGKIAYIWRKVDVVKHADEILDKIKSLKL